MRTMTITAATMASAKDGTLWIVREQNAVDVALDAPPVEFVQACAPCQTCDGEQRVFCPDCNERGSRECVGDGRPHIDCPDCRIELVGPCPTCDGQCWWVNADPDPRTGEPGEPYQVPCQRCHQEGDGNGTVTVGHAYAVGQPLPIVARTWPQVVTVDCISVHQDDDGRPRALHWTVGNNWGTITDRLSHYGPPESLVGKWALQLAVTT